MWKMKRAYFLTYFFALENIFVEESMFQFMVEFDERFVYFVIKLINTFQF